MLQTLWSCASARHFLALALQAHCLFTESGSEHGLTIIFLCTEPSVFAVLSLLNIFMMSLFFVHQQGDPKAELVEYLEAQQIDLLIVGVSKGGRFRCARPASPPGLSDLL